MPLASLFALQWYGPAMAQATVTASASASGGIKGTARPQASISGAASIPTADATRLKNSPATITTTSSLSGTPKGRARPTATIKVNELSQDDVSGAVLEAPVEGGLSLKGAIRLLLAVAAGDATGLDGNPAFKSVDGATTRVAGTRSGGTRTITTRDAT